MMLACRVKQASHCTISVGSTYVGRWGDAQQKSVDPRALHRQNADGRSHCPTKVAWKSMVAHLED